MNKRVLILSFAMFVVITMALVYLLSISLQNVEAKFTIQGGQSVYESMDINHSANFRSEESTSVISFIYLPAVLNNWFSPCGTIPFLVSPPDGSHVTSSTILVFDGGYRGGTYDWLQIEFSKTSDFSTITQSIFYQPAGKLWEQNIENLGLTPDTYYWRASIWCNGPGWPLPPNDYDQSPFSEVWYFIY